MYLNEIRSSKGSGPERRANDPRSRLNLALAYEKLERIEDSLREYEAFVKLAPNDPLAPKIDDLVKKARSALA